MSDNPKAPASSPEAGQELCGEISAFRHEHGFLNESCDLPKGHAGSHRANGVRWLIEPTQQVHPDTERLRTLAYLYYATHQGGSDGRRNDCQCGKCVAWREIDAARRKTQQALAGQTAPNTQPPAESSEPSTSVSKEEGQ